MGISHPGDIIVDDTSALSSGVMVIGSMSDPYQLVADSRRGHIHVFSTKDPGEEEGEGLRLRIQSYQTLRKIRGLLSAEMWNVTSLGRSLVALQIHGGPAHVYDFFSNDLKGSFGTNVRGQTKSCFFPSSGLYVSSTSSAIPTSLRMHKLNIDYEFSRFSVAGSTSVVDEEKRFQRIPVIACNDSLDSDHFIASSEEGTIRVCDVTQSGKVISRLSSHSDIVNCLSLSPTLPNIFLSGSWDLSAKLWDRRTNNTTWTTTISDRVYSLIWTSEHTFFVGTGSTILLFDARSLGENDSPQVVATFESGIAAHHSAVVDEETFGIASREGRCQLWSENGKKLCDKEVWGESYGMCFAGGFDLS